MKKFLKATVLIFAVSITFLFSGCTDYLVDSLTTEYISEEECHIKSGIDAEIYTYSDKLRVKFSYDYDDTLSIKWGTENVNDWYEILSGDFSKAAWYDYKHFVLLNGVYYEFDFRQSRLFDYVCRFQR